MHGLYVLSLAIGFILLAVVIEGFEDPEWWIAAAPLAFFEAALYGCCKRISNIRSCSK